MGGSYFGSKNRTKNDFCLRPALCMRNPENLGKLFLEFGKDGDICREQSDSISSC